MRLRTATALTLALTGVAAGLAGCSPVEPPADCQSVPQQIGDALLAKSTKDGTTIETAEAIPAPDDEGDYLVAARLKVSSTDQNAVWLVNTLDADEASTLQAISVNAVAQQNFSWPGQLDGEQLDINHPGARDALKCIA